MRLRLQPRDATFFTLFTAAGANISACAEVLREFVSASPERRPELAARMREVEHAGDRATHDILDQLNRSFVTPFDREDIYRLAVRLDDVIDFIDAAVDLTTLYWVGDLPASFQFASTRRKAAGPSQSSSTSTVADGSSRTRTSTTVVRAASPNASTTPPSSRRPAPPRPPARTSA